MLNALLDHTLLSAVIAVFSTIFLLCWLGKRPQVCEFSSELRFSAIHAYENVAFTCE